MRMSRNYLRELALPATVAVLCFAGTRFIAGRLRPPQPRALTRAVGERVRIPGVSLATARRNVVLVLSSRCHFCIADSGFHRRLVAEALSSGWAVYAVFSPADADASYPARLGLSPPMVRRIPFDVLGITVTPAVLLVDRTGTIVRSWVGAASSEEQAAIFAALRHPETTFTKQTPAHLDSANSDTAPLVIDVRSREEFRTGHNPDAVNIPLDELEAQLQFRAQASQGVVLDCSRTPPEACDLAKLTVTKMGVTFRGFRAYGSWRMNPCRICLDVRQPPSR